MESSLSRRYIILFVLLSFFIHLLLFVGLFISYVDPHTHFKSLIEQKIPIISSLLKTLTPPQQHQWAATKARASQFGAPVLFFDDDAPDAQHQQSTQDSTPQQSVIEEPATSASVNTATSQEQKATEQPAAIDMQQKKAISTITNDLIAENSTTLIDSRENNIQPKARPSANVDIDNYPNNSTSAQSEQPQSLSMPQSASSAATATTQNSGPKNITLAHITKGFLEQLKNKGDHAVTMKGDPNHLPTDEQLKHERYLQRLQWCLQNSMKIHQHRYTAQQSVKTSLDIYIALDRDGILKELILARSSGIKELDEFMLFVFEDASSGFPSVPLFFKKELYTVIFTVKVNESIDYGFRFFMH